MKGKIRKANDSGTELFISLHCNASSNHQGHGVEIYTWIQESRGYITDQTLYTNLGYKKIAQAIVDVIV